MRTHRNRHGGVLMTVLIFSAVIAVSLTSYVRLASNAYQLAQRSYLETAALALNEGGLEQGLLGFINSATSGAVSAFSAWTTNATTGIATLSLGSFDLGGGMTGAVRVYVSGWNGNLTSAQVIAKTTITIPNAPGITRYTQATLQKSTPAVGLLATGALTINTPYTTFYAWNSLPNGAGGAQVPFSNAVAVPNCSIGVRGGGTATLNNASIFGTIANDSSSAKIVHGSSAVLTSSLSGTGWNSALYSSTFTLTPTVPAAPALPATYNTIASKITASTTFPRSGDVLSADGSYHYNFTGGGINLASGGTITISGNYKYVFHLQGTSGTTALRIGSSGQLYVAWNSTLTVYTDGNIDFTGANGLSNSNNTSTSFVIYGTNATPGGQSFNLTAQSQWIGSVNAPNADVTWTGWNQWLGSIVAHNVTFNNSCGFVYDTAMAAASSSSNTWSVSRWSELTTDAQRAAAASLLNF
jgi:hypothetical protein